MNRHPPAARIDRRYQPLRTDLWRISPRQTVHRPRRRAPATNPQSPACAPAASAALRIFQPYEFRRPPGTAISRRTRRSARGCRPSPSPHRGRSTAQRDTWRTAPPTPRSSRTPAPSSRPARVGRSSRPSGQSTESAREPHRNARIPQRLLDRLHRLQPEVKHRGRQRRIGRSVFETPQQSDAARPPRPTQSPECGHCSQLRGSAGNRTPTSCHLGPSTSTESRLRPVLRLVAPIPLHRCQSAFARPTHRPPTLWECAVWRRWPPPPPATRNARRLCVISSGVSNGRRVHRHLVGTAIQHCCRVVERANASSDRERNKQLLGRAPHRVEQRIARLGRGRDVQQHDLVGARLRCARVASSAGSPASRNLLELDPFHHASGIHVEAGNDALRQRFTGHRSSPGFACPRPRTSRDETARRTDCPALQLP